MSFVWQKKIHFYSWCYLIISPITGSTDFLQGYVAYFSCSVWWNKGFLFFSVNCIYVTLILQPVWIGGVRRMFRPISQDLKVTGMKGKVRGLFWSWNADVVVHPEHTFSTLGFFIFCIKGKHSAKCFILQKACIFAYISIGGSAIISSQNGFLSWKN